jgi:Transposase DDE domain group 1
MLQRRRVGRRLTRGERALERDAAGRVRRHLLSALAVEEPAVLARQLVALAAQALGRARDRLAVLFMANAAWTVIAALAHNLLRWTSVIGLPGQTIRAARTVRRRLFALPGRLTRSARRWTLHLLARWPWQHDFIRALARIRALPATD